MLQSWLIHDDNHPVQCFMHSRNQMHEQSFFNSLSCINIRTETQSMWVLKRWKWKVYVVVTKWTAYSSLTCSCMRVITQVCLPKKLHSHANLPLPKYDKLLQLVKLQQKWIAKAEMCIYTEKMQALLTQEINPFLTKPTQWRILLLKVFFLWVILTHFNDGISSSILVNLLIQLLLVPWMRGWMQCPTLVNDMTSPLTMAANILHSLFMLPLLGKFPENGLSFPTLWHMMVI